MKVYGITDLYYELVSRTVYQSKAEAKIALYELEKKHDGDLIDLGMDGLRIVELDVKLEDSSNE